MSKKMITLKNMCKSFGNVKAVSDVSLDIECSEIRALIGENGSGKSTLTSLITGAQHAESGTIEYRGVTFSSKGILDAKRNGIAVLLQEKGTVNGLTVAENILLGVENRCKGKLGISKNKMNAEALKVLSRIGAESIRPQTVVDRLSFEDRKLVEVARVMLDEPDILIVDETTTALSLSGRETIYKIIRDMKAVGKTIIFISHDLDEVINLCDSASVLRDGRFVKTVDKEEMNHDYLRSLMIGRELGEHYYHENLENHYAGEIVLRVEDISLSNKLKDINFELYKGEILGLGGLTDCGMHELCKVIFGATIPEKGKVVAITDGIEIEISDCVSAIRNKIAYLPKDRDAESLFGSASIRDNITVTSIDQLKKGIYISLRKEKELAQKQLDNLFIKCSGSEQYVNELSGGNKQKVVVGKWLANDSEILIMDCPTRGIDIGVKSTIYSLMKQLTASGKSIIMVSEEMPELLGMSDRIIVLKDGAIANMFMRNQNLKEEDLVRYII